MLNNKITHLFFYLTVLMPIILLSQDVFKIDGKEIKGKYISVDFSTNRFKFIYEGRDTAVELPIDNDRLDYIKLESGKYIFKNPKIIAEEKRQAELRNKAVEDEIRRKKEEKERKKKEEERKIKAEIKAKCDERRNIKVGIIPFKDDLFTATSWVADTLKGMCYGVDFSMVNTISWFEKNDINIKDINDFHLSNAQKELNYDIIVYGYVYTKQDAIITGYTPFTGIYITAFYVDEYGLRQYLFVGERILGFY